MQPGQRQQRKRHIKGEFSLFPNSSLLSHLVQFGKGSGICLELNS